MSMGLATAVGLLLRNAKHNQAVPAYLAMEAGVRYAEVWAAVPGAAPPGTRMAPRRVRC